ncbi:MAG: PAS domain S-box protein, partial [Pseudomonadota bacterium]
DKNILYVNPASERLTGWTSEEAKTKKCFEVFGDEHAKCRDVCPAERAITDGVHVLHGEGRLKNRTGGILDVKVSVSPIRGEAGRAGAVVVMEDVTRLREDERTRAGTLIALEEEIEQRKQVEQRLRESDAQKLAILDGVTTNLAFVNRNLEILWVNKAAADSVGRSASEMIGHKCHGFWADPARPCAGCPTLKAFTTGRTEATTIVTPDGKVWDEKGAPVFGADGRLMGVVEIALDITEHKRVENALRESLTRSGNVFDSLEEAVIITSGDRTVQDINLAAERTFGYPKEEATGRSAEIFHVDHDHYLEFGRRIRPAFDRGAAARFEFRAKRKNGEIFPTDHTVSLLWDEHGNPAGVVSVVRDITARKDAEKTQRQRNEELATVLDTLPALVWIGMDPECRVITGNRVVNELFAVPDGTNLSQTRAEMGQALPIRHLKADGTEYRADELPMQRVISLGKPLHNLEFSYAFPDGRQVYVLGNAAPLFDEDGRVRGSVAAFLDITERRQAEEALRKSRNLLSNYLNSINEMGLGVLVVDRDRKIRHMNPTMVGWFGDHTGKVCYESIGRSSAMCPYCRLTEVIDESQVVRYQPTTPDGRTFSVVAAPVTEIDGSIAKMELIADITDLKRAEELILQAERYRCVADLAGGVAHNFNNLLHIVMGYQEMALLDLEQHNYSDVADALNQVLMSCRSGAETVRRLQSVAGIRDHSQIAEEGVFDLSHIAEVAVEISKTWWKSIPERHGIKIFLNVDLQAGCFVRGEKNELCEVVANLAKNAAEALPKGGAIHIETKVEGDQVVLKVRDTGVGISNENLKRLFNPFFTTKATAGSGLGLASSRKIIKDFGGSILVASAEGKGTTFTVRLPLAEEPVIPAGAATPHVSGSGKTILVIDDMEAVLIILKAGLTRSGHVVLTASSGEQGMDIFERTPIDLVISDLGMPGINGWEIGACIKAVCEQRGIPKPPFILLTGWGGQKDEAERIDQSGVDAVVEKPIDIVSILEIVGRLGEFGPRRAA